MVLIGFSAFNLVMDVVVPPSPDVGSIAYLPPVACALTIMVALAGYMLSRLKAALPLLAVGYISLLTALFTKITLTDNLSIIVASVLMAMTLLFAGVFGKITYLVSTVSTLAVLGYIVTSEPPLLAQPYTLLVLVVPLIISAIIWRPFEKTEEARNESQIEQLEHQLDTESSKAHHVIDAITDGVVAVDQEGTIELINPAAAELLQWKQQDATGIHYEAVIKLASGKGISYEGQQHPLYQVLSQREEFHSDEIELTSAANKKMFVSLRISPLGQNEGAIAIIRNITEEMKENRQKAEFISTASHEMRTPVASIEGYLGLALNPQTAAIDNNARSYILKAHESAQHLGRLFQDLLDITRAEDGRLNNNPIVLNVTDTVREHVKMFQQKAAEKQLTLVFNPDVSHNSTSTIAPVFYAKADRDHLREIVSNLIENAIKYTKQGSVIVDVTGDAKNVTVSVKDSGIGIADEDLPHLFQKFYRIDNSDTREIGGTGLGLYLCRRLAENMDGKIWVESTRGEGSQFFLEISRIPADQITKEDLRRISGEPESASTSSAQPAMATDMSNSSAPAPLPEPPHIQTPQPPTYTSQQQSQMYQASQPAPTPQPPTQTQPQPPAQMTAPSPQMPAQPVAPQLPQAYQNPAEYPPPPQQS